MSESRETILKRLRSTEPGLNIEDSAHRIPVVPVEDHSPEGLFTRYVAAAEALACIVHKPASEADAVRKVLEIIDERSPVLSWELAQISLPGLENAFAVAGVEVTHEPDASAQVGLTGADAALAATGSLVLTTGAGKPRAASLLPPVHITVLRADRILPDMEGWVMAQRELGLEKFRETASAMVISGPSRTADIAMQLTLGMHGPGELHIILMR